MNIEYPSERLFLPPSSPFYDREIFGSMFSDKDFFGVDFWIFDVSIVISRWREFLARATNNEIQQKP